MNDFNKRQKKMVKNIWIKIEVEGEIERRGDSIYKVSNEISKEERRRKEKILYLESYFQLLFKIII